MNKLKEFKCDLFELEKFSKNLSIQTKNSDIFLLKGDLGVGKTTFARFLINSLFDKHNLSRPESIKSPSFPILINYSLNKFEINHYDLYRIKKQEDLIQIDFFESLQKNISIIEWPDILLNKYIAKQYYLIEMEIINQNKRSIKIFHNKKTKL